MQQNCAVGVGVSQLHCSCCLAAQICPTARHLTARATNKYKVCPSAYICITFEIALAFTSQLAFALLHCCALSNHGRGLLCPTPQARTHAAFLRDGGSYLGFCAGAYYACETVAFEPGTAIEVRGARELVLFPGVALGSVAAGFEYNRETGAQVKSLVAAVHTHQLAQICQAKLAHACAAMMRHSAAVTAVMLCGRTLRSI